MVPPSDDTPDSLDGQVTSDGEPDRPVEGSLVGDGETAGIDPSTDSGETAFTADWTPPEILADRYRLEEKIGRGGMGVVYEGRDTRIGRHVALKVMPDAVLGDEVDVLAHRLLGAQGLGLGPP